jgi:hypothetical protein
VHHLWPWLIHVTGSDNGTGRWYLFWSGFAGDITLLAAILAAPYLQWKRHTCQVRRCWRFGRHAFADPEDRVARQLCWKHHPDVQCKQLTVKMLQERHHLYLGRRPGRG